MSENHDPLHETWRKVVDDLVLLAETPGSGMAPLGHQQRAYLLLAKPVALVEGVAVLAAPHARAKELIETELTDAITTVLSQRMGRAFSLAVTVDPTALETRTEPEPEPAPAPEPAPMQPQFQTQQHFHVPAQPEVPAQTQLPTQTHPHTQVQAHMPAEPETLTQPPAQPQQEQPDWSAISIDQASEEGFKRGGSAGIQAPTQPSLNPKYTFDTYVVSDSNKLPTSAAIAVAEKPARAYNPLFIWGDSGLGKTHLMHAIGNYAHQLDPALKIKYVSSEEFTNDYINSVRDDRQENFKRRYRDLDILMVDDIQFLQGKEGTQEEFFHTFNALEQAGAQIVLSSDRPPKQLTTLEDRLRTRFQAGLIADIYPPDLETRIAILMKKAQADNIVADREVMELIASRFSGSIRELEGAFIRVSAYASLDGQDISVEIAEKALRDLVPDQQNITITAENIMNITAEFFQCTPKDLKGTSKTRSIAHARQIAMYLCRELTELSLPKIGEYFGGKDHTTVMYANRKISKELSEKKETYDEIQQVTQRIKNHAKS